jgi:RHS repeat-associated protein
LNFFYDPTTGLLDSLSAPGGNAITYTYDGSLPKKTTWSGEVQGSVEVTYDNDFRVTSQKVNGGNSVSFQYDQDGLLETAGGLIITRDTQNGRITGTTLGSITTGQSYNSFGELAHFYAVFNADTLFKTLYAQDSLGRITEITETIQGQTRKFNYEYDSAGRLSEMSRNDTLLAVYEYDANGNRLNHYTPSATTTGTYDSQDRLLTYGNATYSYTRNGELLAKVVGTDTTRYIYDAFGNLTSVRLPNGMYIEYMLDGKNRRVGKKINGTLVKGWLYGGQLNIVAELDSVGNVVSRFIYGTKAHVPDYFVRGDSTYRIISNHLGSVRLVVNVASGTVTQWIDYDEFGNVTRDTNPGFQPFGFAGGLYDGNTKLVRFGARDYDAESGRWTAKDPIRFAGGQANIYVYVHNDPINLIDPTGLADLCNKSNKPVLVVAGASGGEPAMVMKLDYNKTTPPGFDWDFYQYDGRWYKFSLDSFVSPTGEPGGAWLFYPNIVKLGLLLFDAIPRKAKADPDFNEVDWVNQQIIDAKKQNPQLYQLEQRTEELSKELQRIKELIQERTECGCRQ